jgi:hypothetical protein
MAMTHLFAGIAGSMSNLDRFVNEPIMNSLTTLLAQKKFDTDTQLDIYLSVKRAVQDLQNAQVAELEAKIAKWEEVIEGADNTLYTLGLRHAIDVIRGNVATDFNGYDGEKFDPAQLKDEDGFQI